MELEFVELTEQVSPMKSPLRKGDSGGCVFLGYPRFHEVNFTTPFAPFSKGDFASHVSCNPLK